MQRSLANRRSGAPGIASSLSRACRRQLRYLPIYTSGDFGATWVIRESWRLWNSVISSADGSRLVAVAGDDPNAPSALDFIYASSDQGLTWTPRGAPDNWIGVTSSADGTRLAAVTDWNGSLSLWTSTPTPVNTTASGTGGSITGRRYQAIELQYVGGGRFMVLGAIGTGFDVE